MSTTSNTTQNDITVYRGDDFATQIVFADECNNAMDITGWTILFTVKRRLTDPDSAAVISITTSPSDPTNGTASIIVPSAQTKSLVGAYFYDFRFLNSAGTATTVTSGIITFLDHATRRV